MSSEDRLVGGRYRLRGRLGSGGMGTVWRADDIVLGRQVAVKEVSFPPGTRPEEAEVLRERTRREARSAARLDHPSAVTVYDVVEEDGRPWLVMELVEARTLAQAVTADGPLPPAEVARIGLAVLGALEAAHAQGIVHRDVKPSNVLLRADGRVVLTDFGIATSTGDSSLTHSGLLLGSPAYIAPERARGQHPGPPSDLWSLGATLFTAVEGRPPFDSGDALLTVTAVVTGEHAPYVAAGPLVPVLDGLLEKDPELRLSADAARRRLQDVADHGPAHSTALLLPPTAVSGAATGERVARTSALDLGEVRQEIAAAEPTEVAVPVAAPEPVAGAAPPARPPLVVPGADGPRRPGWLAPAAAGLALLLVAGAGVALALGGDDPDPSAGAGAVASSSPSAAPTTPPPTTAAPTTPAPTTPAPTTPVPTTRRPTTAPATTAPTTAPTTAAPTGGSSGSSVPAGWRTYDGSAGWTVAVPPGYTSQGGGAYRDAATGRTLRIETGAGQPDAVADRRAAARSFRSRHPSYREISIRSADYRGYEAADWEFTYEGLHVIDRVFVVKGTGHSLYFQTRSADFAAARADFDRIAAAFDPVGG